MDRTGTVANHPLVLTVVVVYIGVARIGLSTFPPLGWPHFADLFRCHLMVLLIARIALTYAYASAAREYRMGMFFVELGAGLLYAAQLRLLDLIQQDSTRERMLALYGLQFSVIVTMFLWNWLGALQIAVLRNPKRYIVIRVLGVVALLGGSVVELVGVLEPYRHVSRWVVSIIFCTATIYYLLSSPWKGFAPSSRDG